MRQRNHRIAIAVLGLSAALSAQAQESVMKMEGQLGAGVTRKNNQVGGGSLTELSQNMLALSLLRFSGAEDLGGGMKGIFRLETGLALDNGVAGGNGSGGAKFWNRQSWVGLDLGSNGVLTLGRQFHASTDRVIRSMDVYQVAGNGAHVVPLGLFGVNRFSGNDNRADNAIKYRLTVPGVVDIGLSAAAGEGTSGRSYAADVAHGSANYSIGAFYVHYDATALVAGAMPQHVMSGVGGNYKMGSVRVYAAVMNGSLDATVAGRRTQKNRVVDLGVNWTLAPNLALRAAYYDDKGTDLNGIADRNGKKLTTLVSTEYSLSKRTSLYAAVFQNRFTAGYKLETTNLAALNRNPSAASVTGVSSGINHVF